MAFGNNPVNRVDPYGEDIYWLYDSKSECKKGHSAVVIGSVHKGWHYFTFSPPPEDGLDSRAKVPALKQYYFPAGKALKDVLTSKITSYQIDPNGKQFDWEDDLSRYDHYIEYRTTEAQDRKAYEQALAWEPLKFVLINRNCTDCSGAIVTAAGETILRGTWFGISDPSRTYYETTRPKEYPQFANALPTYIHAPSRHRGLYGSTEELKKGGK